MTCQRCGKNLTEGEEGRVPPFVRFIAALALAPVHMGLWAERVFSQSCCRACRMRLSLLTIGLLAGTILVTAAILRWAIKSDIVFIS